MVIIQPSRPQDAAAIAGCVDRVARERKYLAATQGFPIEATHNFLDFLIKSGGIHFSAFAGQHLVGWCDLTPGPFEGLTHCARLGMGLLPEHRGRGTGKKLLAAIIDAAREKGFEKIELEVFASNHAAVALYEKAGFIREGCKTAARKIDGRYDDILLYGLRLQAIRP